jgi:hypothetical protein
LPPGPGLAGVLPLIVSLDVTGVVVAPPVAGIVLAGSFTASILGKLICTVAVSQTNGAARSHIW